VLKVTVLLKHFTDCLFKVHKIMIAIMIRVTITKLMIASCFKSLSFIALRMLVCS